ncbi:MAG TPA: hypothetical protein VMM54_02685 [Nitrospirota bacterium]|nr:hypothetical protein [Nitrospirota bacterium]
MKSKIIFYIGAIVLFFFSINEYEAIPTVELPGSTTCGFYGEKLEPYIVRLFAEKGGILEGYVNGNNIYVMIKRVYTKMCKDNGMFPRYRVEVKFNDNVALQLSHTDVPFAINAYHDNVKYRVICVDN